MERNGQFREPGKGPYEYQQITDPEKLGQLLCRLWGDCERPLWISRCQYRCSQHDHDVSGVIMITRGGIYIYRSKLLKGMRLRYCFSPISCISIAYDPGMVIFTLPPIFNKQVGDEEAADQSSTREEEAPKAQDMMPLLNLLQENRKSLTETRIRVETNAAEKMFLLLVELIQNNTFGLTNATLPALVPSRPLHFPPKPTERPKHSLKRRAMLLAHMCQNTRGFNCVEQKQKPLDSCKYFQTKWDGGSTLFLGQSFHPTIFGKEYGHAIGWETSIDTVCFRTAKFAQFPELCDGILSNAQTIKKLAFLDYKRGHTLSFKFTDIPSTPVKKWWFINSCQGVIAPFLSASRRLPEPIHELVIAKHSYNLEDSAKMFELMRSSHNITSMQILELQNLNFMSFPMDEFSLLVNKFRCLEKLCMKGLNVDGNDVLAAVSRGRGYIRHLALTHLRFANEIAGNIVMPAGLVVLDVSKSQFIGKGFANFFRAITHTQTKDPFVFIARKLQITEDEYRQLESLQLSGCKPNILEFNYSGNNIISVGFPYFFGFLNTQRRMTHIILDDAVTDEATKLVWQLRCTIRAVGLKSLELGVRFPETVMDMLLSSLGAGCDSLRRLGLRNSGLGNGGLHVILSLLKVLSNLTDIDCDGFRTKPLTVDEIARMKLSKHPLIEFCKQVRQATNIKHCVFPTSDFNMAQIDIDKLTTHEKECVRYVKGLGAPVSQKQRILDLLAQPFEITHTKAEVDSSDEEDEESAYEVEEEEEEEEEEEAVENETVTNTL